MLKMHWGRKDQSIIYGGSRERNGYACCVGRRRIKVKIKNCLYVLIVALGWVKTLPVAVSPFETSTIFPACVTHNHPLQVHDHHGISVAP